MSDIFPAATINAGRCGAFSPRRRWLRPVLQEAHPPLGGTAAEGVLASVRRAGNRGAYRLRVSASGSPHWSIPMNKHDVGECGNGRVSGSEPVLLRSKGDIILMVTCVQEAI